MMPIIRQVLITGEVCSEADSRFGRHYVGYAGNSLHGCVVGSVDRELHGVLVDTCVVGLDAFGRSPTLSCPS